MIQCCGVLTADELPEDNADLATIDVDFPRIDPDTAEHGPESTDELLEYLALQVPDSASLSGTSLTFLRTARVDTTNYWIWTFDDAEGRRWYATMSVNPRGNTMLGCGEDYYGLTPEQFMLGEFHQCF